MLFRIGSCSGDIKISYTVVVILSFPAPEPNTLWYESNTEIKISCVKVDVVSNNGLVSTLIMPLSRSNQVQIFQFYC